MKNFLDNLKKNWKKIILYLLVLFLSFCAFLSSCKRNNNSSAATISANADEITQPTINLEDYGFNFFPYPYNFQNDYLDEYLTIYDDGRIILDGVVPETYHIWSCYIYLDEGYYYFSGNRAGLSNLGFHDATVPGGVFQGSFYVTERTRHSFYVYVPAGTYDNVDISPMLVKGQSLPAWTPPLDLILYDFGYDAGFNEGLNVYNYGSFYKANVNVSFFVDGQILPVTFNIPFDYESGSFYNVYQYIYDNYNNVNITYPIYIKLAPYYTLYLRDLSLTLSTNDFNSLLNLSGVYNAVPEPYYGETSFNLGFSTENGYLYYSNFVDNYTNEFLVNINFNVTDYNVLKGVSIYGQDLSKKAIYDDGYSAGFDKSQSDFNSNFNNAYNDGYLAGEQFGYENGNADGYTQGFNEGRDYAQELNNYTFLSLIDSIGYGITKPFVSLLNFDLLGMNLLSFVTGLLSLVLIIKLVSFFI